MEKRTKKELLDIIYRASIIVVSLIGICSPSQNSFFNQFWFFTLQTNSFVVIIMLTIIFVQIANLLGAKIKFINSVWFNYIKLSTTFYITITGFIYCFILAPVAIITNSPLATSITHRDIFLHVIVPIMTIIEYYLLSNKSILKSSDALLFLIYPILYVITIFLRAIFGGSPFPGGSIYPYFFIDPFFNNQGWDMVTFYIALCLISFYLLGLLYIYINNKIIKNTDIKK